MNTTAVEVRDLVKRYGRITAVDGLSLCAERGAVTAVLGPNGAGKTSTVEICEGYAAPTRVPCPCSAWTRWPTRARSGPGWV